MQTELSQAQIIFWAIALNAAMVIIAVGIGWLAAQAPKTKTNIAIAAMVITSAAVPLSLAMVVASPGTQIGFINAFIGITLLMATISGLSFYKARELHFISC